MRIFITAGGTGGHIFPGIALFNDFIENGDEVFFIGGERDRRFDAIRKLGHRHIILPGAPLYRKKIYRNFRTLWRFFRGCIRSFSLVRALRPEVCVGMGGYITAPLLLICRLLRIPYVLCEQNAYPGIANRLLAGGAARILLTFPAAENHFNPRKLKKCVLTGNPVRPGFEKAERTLARGYFGIPAGATVLAVTGGSQGAAGINAALIALQGRLKNSVVLWSCGEKHYDTIRRRIKSRSYQLHAFVDRMDLFLAAADLVVSRSGATALSEIAVSGKPSVLVPYPFATADHQTANAKGFATAGAALVVAEGENFTERLEEAVLSLLKDKKRLMRMGRKAAGLYKKNTVKKIVAQVYGAGRKEPLLPKKDITEKQ